MLERDSQATEIDAGDAARRFTAWLTGGGSPVLDGVKATCLWRPRDAGGLGALAESESDLAELRAEITASWLRSQQGREPDERAER
jgi:hypothetical protein